MQEAQPLRGFVILVVDDDADNRDTAAAMIVSFGCGVLRAASSDEALSILGSGAHVDLVFSDVVMPKTSGVTLARLVRERHLGLPIVLATGHAEAIDAVTESGAIPLIKPYSMERLGAVLGEQLRVGDAAPGG
jgi:CheY-like chemotaxis protein